MSLVCVYCRIPWPGDGSVSIDDMLDGKPDFPVCIKAPPKDRWLKDSGINGHMFKDDEAAPVPTPTVKPWSRPKQTERVTLRLSTAQMSRIRAAAAKDRRSIGKWIRLAIADALGTGESAALQAARSAVARLTESERRSMAAMMLAEKIIEARTKLRELESRFVDIFNGHASDVAPSNEHPDGCHTADPIELRDCESDGHYSCRTCSRRVEREDKTP